ncbi:MAG: hypothetical protein DRN61_00020 [Thaumarchaeota archaeon]|nr:MAG: hypothetical protein DRN61_00020 [Nitrososphaerota archaeon]
MNNYVEELVEAWLKFNGYITCRNVPFWKPESKGRRQPQWGDIDVLGIKDDEAILVECKEFLGTKRIEEWPIELSQEFKEAEEVLKGKVKNPYGVPCPNLSKKKIKRLLVAVSPKNLKSYKDALEPQGIEVKSFKKVLNEILEYLYKHMDIKPGRAGKYGKHYGLIRFLITLIYYDMLK